MEIKLGNILIKEVTVKDSAILFEWKKDKGITEDDIIATIKNDFDTYMHLLVINKKAIGEMYYHFQGKKADIGIKVYDNKFQNKDIETKVLTSLLFYLFNMYRVDCVLANDEDMYEKAGFIKVDNGYYLESKRYHELYRCD